ncbi:uncharacterized protein MELLADRAFT_66205 [Melampsora larici-populina 98AG31]|uniref:DUF6589 domain-containing protein n=1 Tax=Melampsora larici-populina (strain 98AG31 / pathotype 3-4-7) TaxID=747676 RepID=F4RY90_MELLP|nr:uncharacterized protein MELLADRAFT_66205 [Melampsora larici-populina 98AG31]EGG02637.1 hypothetical protein MELLADRAFT_66205 [Melampsora larici-populina 98AG31]
MDAPDNSVEGVSRVLEQVMGQIGVDLEKYAEKLSVAGGNIGSNQLIESLQVKTFPRVDSFKGLGFVLLIFGGAHTTWKFTKALLALHWGNLENGEDLGAWRSWFALGGDHKKPVASQDFNTIMRSMHMIHKANLGGHEH